MRQLFKLAILLLLFIPYADAQTVDKLRLVFDEKEVVSKQVGVSVSNDGKLGAFVYSNKTIKVVNLVNGQTLTKFKGVFEDLIEIRFNYNNKKIVCAGDKTGVFIYNLETGSNDTVFNMQSNISRIDLSESANYLSIGQSHAKLIVYNMDLKKNKLDLDLSRLGINAIDFNPKKNEIAIGKSASRYGKNLEIYSLETGQLIKSFGYGIFTDIKYSEDGSKLYVCGSVKNKLPVSLLYKGFGFIIGYYELENYKWKKIRREPIVYKIASGNSSINSINFSESALLFCREGNSFDVITEDGKLKYTTKNEQMGFSKAGYFKKRIYSLFDGKSYLVNSSDNNICFIYNSEKNAITAYIYSDANDDFVVVSRDGRLDGEQNAIAKLYWSERRSSKRIPIEATFSQFYTPNLLSQLLTGAKMEEIRVDINNLKPLPELKFINPVIDTVIEFRSVTEPTLITSEKVLKLEFRATDKGGGLTETRVYQNGKLVQSSVENVNQLDQQVKKTFNIDLVPGNNLIKIVGTNADKIEGASTVVVKYEGKDTDPAKLYVLAIGINKYEKSAYDLNFAVPDASGFIEAIHSASGDLFAGVNVTLIKDGEATKENILAAVEKMKPLIKQNDVFVFYYAGHGAMSIPTQGQQAEFHLVPNDITNFYSTEMLKAKGISADELKNISKEVNAQKQLFVIDACQSGGAVEALASRGALNEKELANLARSTGTYFLTASASDQLAGEFATLGHGVFTYSILLGLTGKADALNGDSKISVKELSLYVENMVPELSEKYKGQRQFPVSFGYGQDFPIVIANKYAMVDVANKAGKYSSYSLEELTKLKQEAVQKEDYDAAKEIKAEIEKRTK